jgi:hypothetical protein
MNGGLGLEVPTGLKIQSAPKELCPSHSQFILVCTTQDSVLQGLPILARHLFAGQHNSEADRLSQYKDFKTTLILRAYSVISNI